MTPPLFFFAHPHVGTVGLPGAKPSHLLQYPYYEIVFTARPVYKANAGTGPRPTDVRFVLNDSNTKSTMTTCIIKDSPPKNRRLRKEYRNKRRVRNERRAEEGRREERRGEGDVHGNDKVWQKKSNAQRVRLVWLLHEGVNLSIFFSHLQTNSVKWLKQLSDCLKEKTWWERRLHYIGEITGSQRRRRWYLRCFA